MTLIIIIALAMALLVIGATIAFVACKLNKKAKIKKDLENTRRQILASRLAHQKLLAKIARKQAEEKAKVSIKKKHHHHKNFGQGEIVLDAYELPPLGGSKALVDADAGTKIIGSLDELKNGLYDSYLLED